MMETMMQCAVILAQVELDLGKTEDQVIELTEMGSEFLIDKIILGSPSQAPIIATGAQVFDGAEKTGRLLFSSMDYVAQYDYLNSLLAESNYFTMKVPTNDFPVVNHNHIVRTNKLYLTVHTPHRGAKVTAYVLGYILK
jgi:hypothetical protein